MNPTEAALTLEKELAATVKAGAFDSREMAFVDAVSTWFAVKPNLKLEAAIQMFRSSEITLTRAAEMAGLNRWRFQDVLSQRNIKMEIETDSPEELDQAIAEMGAHD